MTTPTTHYSFGKPINGADADTWGTELNAALDAIDATIYSVANTGLGFTPVQQGGGTGQGTNKLYFGWSGSGVKVQVDYTDLGVIPTVGAPNGFLQLAGSSAAPSVTTSSSAPSGGNDGDIWLQYT